MRVQVVEDADGRALSEARVERKESSDEMLAVTQRHSMQTHSDALGLGLIVLNRLGSFFTFGGGCRRASSSTDRGEGRVLNDIADDSLGTWDTGAVPMGNTEQKRSADMREAKADSQRLLAAIQKGGKTKTKSEAKKNSCARALLPRTTCAAGELFPSKDARHGNRRFGVRDHDHVPKQRS